ncbi:leucine-rich repeat protein SHOC-2-like [Schistocerca gregaria]|uniref:leucine-rich repeat protein SHOC-2-like n=1 Tax=Schistocerca gregaria TaxID=7010 RepID=UPI00211E545D|nr:leucine-rich repeat protein SHOC-2-like [Schistocerca gregaria]
MGSRLSVKAKNTIKIALANDLDELRLSGCNIKSIPASEIKKWQNIRVLVLSENYIVRLPNKIDCLVSLEVLKIDSNELVGLPESLLDFKKLRILKLAYNKLTKLPGPLYRLGALERLNVFANPLPSEYLSTLIRQLQPITSLCSLNCGGVSLKSWPETLFEVQQLQELNIKRNQLTEIPDSISNLVNLKKLILSHNPIEVLPISVSKLNKLTRIECVECLFSDLHQYPFDQLKELRIVNFNSCKLTSFPFYLGYVTNLQVLDFGCNLITKLSHTIGYIGSSLKKLDVSQNQLTALPGELSMLDLNIDLDLQQNNLRSPFKENAHSNPQLFEAIIRFCRAWGPNCTIEKDAFTTAVKNVPGVFLLTAFDYINRPRISGGDIIEVSITETNPENPEDKRPPINRDSFLCAHTKDLKNGTYEINYVFKKSGTFEVEITCDSMQVRGSPFSIVVFDS